MPSQFITLHNMVDKGHHTPSMYQITERIKYDVLQQQRSFLTLHLNPERHLDFLRSKYLLSEEDSQEIQAKVTRRARASFFLDILLTRGSEGYDALCESLKLDRTQLFLLENLNTDYERRLRKYEELSNPGSSLGMNIPPPALSPPPPSSSWNNLSSPTPVEHQQAEQHMPTNLATGGSGAVRNPQTSGLPGPVLDIIRDLQIEHDFSSATQRQTDPPALSRVFVNLTSRGGPEQHEDIEHPAVGMGASSVNSEHISQSAAQENLTQDLASSSLLASPSGPAEEESNNQQRNSSYC